MSKPGSVLSEETKEKNRIRSSKWYWDQMEIDPDFREKRAEHARKHREAYPEKRMYYSALTRAKELEVPFDIEATDIEIPEECPILKVTMERGTPYAPSLDRIVPDLGYIRGNIQVISHKANMMKQDATREELWRFAEWVNQLSP